MLFYFEKPPCWSKMARFRLIWSRGDDSASCRSGRRLLPEDWEDEAASSLPSRCPLFEPSDAFRSIGSFSRISLSFEHFSVDSRPTLVLSTRLFFDVLKVWWENDFWRLPDGSWGLILSSSTCGYDYAWCCKCGGLQPESWRRMECIGCVLDAFLGVISEPKWDTWGASRRASCSGTGIMQLEKSDDASPFRLSAPDATMSGVSFEWLASSKGLICDWLMSSRMESSSGFCGVCLTLELLSSSILSLIIFVVSAFRFSRSKKERMFFLQICFTI